MAESVAHALERCVEPQCHRVRVVRYWQLLVLVVVVVS